MLIFLAGSCLLCAAVLFCDELCAHCSTMCRSPAADAFLVYEPQPATPHTDRGAAGLSFAWRSWCCCVVSLEARSNSIGIRAHKEHTARASTAKFLWSARKVLCVARALKLAGSARGQFLLVCLLVSREFCLAMLVAIPWAAQSPSPQTPNRPP